MNKAEFEKRKEFAKDLLEKRHLTAYEIAMILWGTRCEHCYYRSVTTNCEGHDCSIGVKTKAVKDFEEFYDLGEHGEVGGEA